MPDITFKDFSFRYDNLKQPTLKNINLDIKAGEKVLIAGPSGSGKSTLAHCINGLIPFTYKGEIKGSIKIGDIMPWERSIYEISKYVGTILQDQDGQFVGLTVGEDVAFSYENNCTGQREMQSGVIRALSEVGMCDYIKETPQNLSGGQKQKVSIAGILTTDADILLFDEPLANLDPASGYKALEIIDDIHKSTGKTIIIVEHRIEDVLEHGVDRIIILNEGEIAANGSPDDILSSDILSSNGLREPLYVNLLKRMGIKLSSRDGISNIKNAVKFRDSVVCLYENRINKNEPAVKDNILSLRNVSYKYYSDMPFTIKNISFDIREGEILSILGNNGAGKSTLLKVMAGIAKHQEGTVLFEGQSIDEWSIKKRSKILGYVMQNPNHMIVKNMISDEVAFGLRNFGYDENDVKSNVEEALRICGLYMYRNWPVSSLSYGQKKRVTIGSILAMKPKIIILDEPTAGQDYRNYREFMKYLEEIKKSGVSIVMITHDMHLALEYSDRAIVLSGGEIISSDTVYSVLSNGDVIRRANLKEISLSTLGRLYGIEDRDGFLSYSVSLLKEGDVSE